MRKLINRVLRNESGAAAMEYSTIGALVGVAIIVAGGLFFGNATGGAAGSMGNKLNAVHTNLQSFIATMTP